MLQGDRVVCTNVAADTFHCFMNVKKLLTVFGFIVSIEVLNFFSQVKCILQH